MIIHHDYIIAAAPMFMEDVLFFFLLFSLCGTDVKTNKKKK